MRALLALVAAVSLVAAAGACGSTITVPDQGVIVLSCSVPNYCYRLDCDCTRKRATPPSQIPDPADAGPTVGTCIVAPDNCTSDNATCTCPGSVADPGAPDGGVEVQCKETAALCVGRGVLCAVGSNCRPVGSSCDNPNVNGEPPQLVAPPNGASGPALEPHCAYVDDVCCPGPAVVDAGTTD